MELFLCSYGRPKFVEYDFVFHLSFHGALRVVFACLFTKGYQSRSLILERFVGCWV